MSRIGKLPINVPNGVTITVGPEFISVKGPKGENSVPHLENINITQEDSKVVITRDNDEKAIKAKHGLTRALLANAINGVVSGYQKSLEINGVGYRVTSKGDQDIELTLGFSHVVNYHAPEGIKLLVNKMKISVVGIDKQLVGQVAADIRSLKKPEPYKGKGIKYTDEVILRKAGKTGK